MKFLCKSYLYFIYPVYTLWFASHASLVNENLSYIGNALDFRVHFIVWSFACVMALAIGFSSCLKKCLHKRVLGFIICLCAILFLLSVLLPYLPDVYPLIADLHVNLSFLSLYSLLIVIVLLVLSLRLNHPIRIYLYFLGMIYGIALMIFSYHYMSVNSLVEVFLGIALPIYLDSLGGSL